LDAVVSSLLASQLTPTAIELETKPLRLLVRFESIEAAATEQARQATRIAESNGAGTTIVAGADETALWEAHERRAWEDDGAVIKLTLLPKDLSATLAWLASTGEAWEMIGRAGVGALLLRVDGDAAAQARVLKDLRARFAPGRGSAVLVRGSEALKALGDVWGPPGAGRTGQTGRRERGARRIRADSRVARADAGAEAAEERRVRRRNRRCRVQRRVLLRLPPGRPHHRRRTRRSDPDWRPRRQA